MAKAFDVSFETLRQRSLGRLVKSEKRLAACKLTQTEEELLVQRITDLIHDGFPPQTAIVRDTANLILKTRNT